MKTFKNIKSFKNLSIILLLVSIILISASHTLFAPKKEGFDIFRNPVKDIKTISGFISGSKSKDIKEKLTENGDEEDEEDEEDVEDEEYQDEDVEESFNDFNDYKEFKTFKEFSKFKEMMNNSKPVKNTKFISKSNSKGKEGFKSNPGVKNGLIKSKVFGF
tara:strand:+ start:318 stop:800 length:483 start_codon:yes stop_codon:yes gene_type:complete